MSGCGLVSLPGQRPTGPRRIGHLDSGTIAPATEAFRAGLRELGYVEGQDLLIEYRSAEGNIERLPALAAELVGLPVEVIVTSNQPAALAASRATPTIPIVASGSGDIVGGGLVNNIARPEGNVTGVSTSSVALSGKLIELLTETVPTISHLAVVVDLSSSSAEGHRQFERAAQSLRLQLTAYDLRDLDQLSAVLSTVNADRADGLVFRSGGILAAGQNPRIGDEALKSRLPAVAESRLFAVNGGLLAHGSDGLAVAKRSASYVDKILKGAKPGDLPIELPTEFNIVVNLKTAQELGIAVPQSVLLRATEVIQ